MTSTNIFQLFAPFKGSIAITFSLLSIENIIMVLTPLLFGWTIDGLIAKDILPLYCLVAVLILGTIIGTGRRLYDTRCYGRIYKEIAFENARTGWKSGIPASAISARTEQVQEAVQFLEIDLVESFNATIKVIGALIMLGILNISLLVGVLLTVLGGGIIYSLSGAKIYRLNRGLNNQLDHQVQKIITQDPARLSAHFSSVVRWSIRLSNLEARNFALLDMLVIALVAFSLWESTISGAMSPGMVFILLSYVLEFVEGSYQLPLTYQKYIRLKEIFSRLTLNQR